MNKCKNCQTNKITKTVKQRTSHSQEHVHKFSHNHKNEYDIAQVFYGNSKNDDYLIETIYRNQEKMRRMEKEMKRMKGSIRNLQRSLQHMPHKLLTHSDTRNYPLHRYGEYSYGLEETESKGLSVISSKKELGRVTRVTERESRSSSKSSMNQLMTSYFPFPSQPELEVKNSRESQQAKKTKTERNISTLSFENERPKFLMHKDFKHQNKEVLEQKVKNEIEMYLPHYEPNNSLSSDLLEISHSSLLIDEKEKIERELESLILLEKVKYSLFRKQMKNKSKEYERNSKDYQKHFSELKIDHKFCRFCYSSSLFKSRFSTKRII